VTTGPRRPAANLVALAVLALAMFWGVAGALPGLASAAAGPADRPLAPITTPGQATTPRQATTGQATAAGQAARTAPTAPSRAPGW
jgi:hypothetical protein